MVMLNIEKNKTGLFEQKSTYQYVFIMFFQKLFYSILTSVVKYFYHLTTKLIVTFFSYINCYLVFISKELKIPIKKK